MYDTTIGPSSIVRRSLRWPSRTQIRTIRTRANVPSMSATTVWDIVPIVSSSGATVWATFHYFDVCMANAVRRTGNEEEGHMHMHEEDGGLLWKHVEYRNGHNESRRSRVLVISSIATVVNYEYLFYWRLRLDGTISSLRLALAANCRPTCQVAMRTRPVRAIWRRGRAGRLTRRSISTCSVHD